MKHNPTKTTPGIRNWPEYNRALAQRGSLTLWITQEAIDGWLNAEKTGKRGASETYSDLAIETLLVLRSAYGLPYRQTVGFARSIFEMMGLALPLPHYSRLCCRQGVLAVEITDRLATRSKNSAEGMCVVIDSTGLKLYGQGEWHARQHGRQKRRGWHKLHLGIDADTHRIVAVSLSDKAVHDCIVVPELLEQIAEPIKTVPADGAYDTFEVYEQLMARGALPIIPPRRGARICKHGNCRGDPHPRDEHIRQIRRVGRAEWKRQTGYHRRSLAETGIGRYKQIHGPSMRSRRWDNQETEVMINCKVLNRMAALGLPDRTVAG